LATHQSHLAGERFTMADITAFAGLAFADIAKIEVPIDLVRLRAWRDRVAGAPQRRVRLTGDEMQWN
jgi:glutathione S-transferase